VIAIARQFADESIVVLFNASRETRVLDLPLASLVADGTVLSESWTHEAIKVERGMIGGLKLAPRSARVFTTP
jgi:neopullulanase